MYFVAAVLAVLAGLFYAAGNHEIGSWGVEMCRYGATFCDSPAWILAGAVLAAILGWLRQRSLTPFISHRDSVVEPASVREYQAQDPASACSA